MKNIILAKEAALKLANVSAEKKNKALDYTREALRKNKSLILKENKKDILAAEKEGITKALLKRLELNENKIEDMIKGLSDLIELDDPAGKIVSITQLDKGLELYKVTVPIGVIGVIFEARPDALVQISSLCLKSGNAAVLKGGREALNSNRILFKLIRAAVRKAGIDENCMQLIETREDVRKLLKMERYIDLLIPRGSNSFVKYIMDNTKIPVLGHAAGICHVYVDKDANLKKALNVSFDSKCQYAAVCNAMETLLIDKKIAGWFLPLIADKYLKNSVELRLDNESMLLLKKSMKNNPIIKNSLLNKKIRKAVEADWSTEYNDLIVSIRIVDSVDEAIAHINKYSSKHTDAIVTENKKIAARFMNFVDSSSVMWNASTRFSDGFRYGFGAEVGISTNKIHARGPVGLDGLMTYKYQMIGKGHVVSDYVGKNARKFTHRKLK